MSVGSPTTPNCLVQVAWNTQMMFRALDKHMAQEHVVSYLPLAHIAAQILDIYVTMASGGTTWFALPDALKVWVWVWACCKSSAVAS